MQRRFSGQRNTNGLERSVVAREQQVQQSLPPPSPVRAVHEYERSARSRKFGLLAGLVVTLAILSRFNRGQQIPADTSPAPDITGDIQVHGVTVMLETLYAAYNQTFPNDRMPLHTEEHALPESREVPFAGVEASSSGSRQRNGRSVRKPRVPTPEQARQILARQQQMKEELQASALETHIRFFAGKSKRAVKESEQHKALVEAIERAPRCHIEEVVDFEFFNGIEYHSNEGGDCHWETVDTASCYSASSIADRLAELNPEEPNLVKGFLIRTFNSLHSGTACPEKADLPDSLHAGTGGFYRPDGTFNQESFDSLLAFARHVQGGRDDILLLSTLRKFADVQEQFRVSQQGSKSWIPFWNTLKRWVQTQAAEEARDEVLSTSYPTAAPLTATYTTVEDGKTVTVTEPCIQSALYLLFLADTPGYFEVAKLARSEAASSVAPEPESTAPTLS